MFISQPTFAFDINGDGEEGLAEAIHALQVVAGLIPDTTSEGDAEEEDVLSGKTFSSDSGTGLTGTRPPAPPAKSGQTISYHSGDDGDLQRGVIVDSTRFSDNGDGTITDNQTGLIWLKQCSCLSSIAWDSAIVQARSLTSGYCGLSDGSVAGDWRIPNIKELLSLVDYGKYMPAVPTGHPFVGTISTSFWTSSTLSLNTSMAWSIQLDIGELFYNDKLALRGFLPVKGGTSD